MKILKGGEKKPTHLGTLRPEKYCYGEFLGYSFCLTYSRYGGKEANNLEMTVDIEKKEKKSKQMLAFSSQRTRKGATFQERQFLDNTQYTLLNTIRNSCPITTHANKAQLGSLEFHLHKGIMRYMDTSLGCC